MKTIKHWLWNILVLFTVSLALGVGFAYSVIAEQAIKEAQK